MAAEVSNEDRRRKSRNILLAAFAVLIMVWIFKLSHPKYSIATSYSPAPQVPFTPTKPESGPAPPKDSAPPKEPPSSHHFNGTVTNRAAVIIEMGFRTTLVPLILHFGTVLGPNWPILVYTAADQVSQYSSSSALGRYIDSGAVQVRILHQSTFLHDAQSFSEFMTNSWLWEDLAPAEHILLFKSDSMLCGNAARSVDDFLEYDFIGAPVTAEKPADYVGGLSLRKRSSILRVLDGWSWEATKGDGNYFEDQWFYNRFKEMQQQGEEDPLNPQAKDAIKLPTAAVAKTFSVGSIEFPHPLGVQQVHRWDETQNDKLHDWCPESWLCRKDPVTDP